MRRSGRADRGAGHGGRLYELFTLTTTANVTPEKAWSRRSAISAPSRTGWARPASISTGNGEVGTIRLLNNGTVTEMMVAKTPFSYTYIQPLNPANLYHGTLAVEPDGAGHSKIIYTFLYDQDRWAMPTPRRKPQAAHRPLHSRAGQDEGDGGSDPESAIGRRVPDGQPCSRRRQRLRPRPG